MWYSFFARGGCKTSMDSEGKGILHEELHIIRKAAGLCQAGLARRLNISQGAISCYERGATNIPPTISDEVYRQMCGDPTAVESESYARMQEECARAFEEARRAQERLAEFWEQNVSRDWWRTSRGDDGAIAEEF